ncbi:hypothetical protein CG51_14090 [Haematobacter missouriensis]|uniref:Uncharacterized protein n=2 Tax=Haematobacter missouriensis TaxID=366616 RepID=A0A212AUD9_9RHOB|nr:hypothetical protein CG51_14090 [Haematobacter missouriensis]OWJ75155.1 hypothetical protein CDV53_11430 [Haematobacter missouriensis]OWJ85098.1 hypothetical protein CDV52_06530 [Haematobacter missouriensis]
MENHARSDEEMERPKEAEGGFAIAVLDFPNFSSRVAGPGIMRGFTPVDEKISEGFFSKKPHFQQSVNSQGIIESKLPAVIGPSTPPIANNPSLQTQNQDDIAGRDAPVREMSPPEITATMPPGLAAPFRSGKPICPRLRPVRMQLTPTTRKVVQNTLWIVRL